VDHINIEAKKNKIQDLEVISERLKEEITHLKEDIKRTRKGICWQFFTLYKFT